MLSSIRRLANGTHTVRHHAPGTMVNGRYTPGAVLSTETFVGSIQPVSGESLMALPDARRSDDMIVVFSPIKLIANEETPDVIVYNGDAWEVFKVRDWNTRRERFYQAWAVKLV